MMAVAPTRIGRAMRTILATAESWGGRKCPRRVDPTGPDKALAWLILLCSLGVTLAAFVMRSRYFLVSIWGIGSSGVYLAVGNRRLAGRRFDRGASRRVLTSSCAIFLALFSASVVTLRNPDNPYTRSVLHFLFSSAMFGFASITVLRASAIRVCVYMYV